MIVVGFSSWRALRDTTTTAKAGTTEDTEGHGVFGAESAKGRDTQQKLEPRRTRRGTGRGMAFYCKGAEDGGKLEPRGSRRARGKGTALNTKDSDKGGTFRDSQKTAGHAARHWWMGNALWDLS